MIKAACLWLRLCTSLSGQAWTLDGDTIVVQGYHIRLAGVDAEELNEPHGVEAKRAMMRYIAASEVTCELTGQRSYERYVGTCYVGNNDLGLQLIKDGLALDCERYSNGKYRQFEPELVRYRLAQKPYCRR